MTNDLIRYHEEQAKRAIKPVLDVNRLVKMANAKNTALDVQYTRRTSEPLTQHQLYFAGGTAGVVFLVAGGIFAALNWRLGGEVVALAIGAIGGLLAAIPAMAAVIYWELQSNESNEAVTVSSITAELMQAAMGTVEQVEQVEQVQTWGTLPLDIQARPHILIVGSTGAGKSITLNAVCERLASRHPAAQWLICDYGGAEWKQAQAHTADGIAETLISLSDVVQARLGRYDGRLDENERLFVVLEEFESVLDDLKIMDSKLGKQALLAARDIARRGRKVGVHLIVVVQSGKADTLDTAIRNNLDMRLVMRSPATVQRSLEVTADMTTAERGLVWCSESGGVVSVPFTRQPELPLYALLGGSGGGSGMGTSTDAGTASESLGNQFFSRVVPVGEPVPDMDILAILAAVDGLEPATAGEIVRRVQAGESGNAIHTAVGGNRQNVLAAVRVARG